MPWERLGGKVTSCQTGRLAVIYVRQSTKQQVIDHSESTRLQYALAGRAAAELHLIKQRMQAGRVSKARRGEMAIALPAGYARRPSGEAVFDPDEQIQAVVRLVFAKFAEIGTVQGVMRYLVEQGIEVGIR